MTTNKTNRPSEDEAIKIVVEDIKSLPKEEGFYAIGAIGEDTFPLVELASLAQPKRVARLKEIALERKIKAEETYKYGFTKITKTKDGLKIEHESIIYPKA